MMEVKYRIFTHTITKRHFIFIEKDDSVECENCNSNIPPGKPIFFKLKYGYIKHEQKLLCSACIKKHKYKRADYKAEKLMILMVTTVIPDNCILEDYSKFYLQDSINNGKELTVYDAVFANIGTKDSLPQTNNRCRVALDPNQSKQLDYDDHVHEKTITDIADRVLHSAQQIEDELFAIQSSRAVIEHADKKRIGDKRDNTKNKKPSTKREK